MRKTTFTRFNLYLNYLFLSLITFECIQLILIYRNPPPEFSFALGKPQFVDFKTENDLSKRPDIYLLVFDAYANPKNQKKYFNFDDSAFLKKLESKSFQVISNSKSNYDWTLKTISSVFNLNYLPKEAYFYQNPNYATLKYDEFLRRNYVIQLLQENEYTFKNISIFDMEGFETPVRDNLHYFALNSYNYYYFLYAKTLIGYLHQVLEKFIQYKREIKAINLMKAEIVKTEERPKLVYFHSMICHEPYYFNEDGDLLEDNRFFFATKEKYIEQIKFANSVALDIVNLIFENGMNSIIILISDHGFRNLTGLPAKEIKEEGYSNFCAIYFPDKDYSQVYDSITPINVMRLVLNKALKTNFEKLPDEIHN
ncbi:MAG: hypothetical protein AABY93_00630 [Bacteroidota bacterium]